MSDMQTVVTLLTGASIQAPVKKDKAKSLQSSESFVLAEPECVRKLKEISPELYESVMSYVQELADSETIAPLPIEEKIHYLKLGVSYLAAGQPFLLKLKNLSLELYESWINMKKDMIQFQGDVANVAAEAQKDVIRQDYYASMAQAIGSGVTAVATATCAGIGMVKTDKLTKEASDHHAAAALLEDVNLDLKDPAAAVQGGGAVPGAPQPEPVPARQAHLNGMDAPARQAENTAIDSRADQIANRNYIADRRNGPLPKGTDGRGNSVSPERQRTRIVAGEMSRVERTAAIDANELMINAERNVANSAATRASINNQMWTSTAPQLINGVVQGCTQAVVAKTHHEKAEDQVKSTLADNAKNQVNQTTEAMGRNADTARDYAQGISADIRKLAEANSR